MFLTMIVGWPGICLVRYCATMRASRVYSVDASLPTNKQGQFKKHVDAKGNEIAVVSYTADNKPAEIQRSGSEVAGKRALHRDQHVMAVDG